MQAARYLVGTFIELAACMQHRHHYLKSAAMLFLVHVHGNTAAIVLHGDRVIRINGDFNVRAVTGKRLVDGVVHHFIDKMVQPFLANVSNVHSRTLAHSFQPFKHLNVAGRIVFPASHVFCFHSYYLSTRKGRHFF